MSTSYAGQPDDLPALRIPEDQDLLDAESVNIALRSLRDTTRALAAVAGGWPVYSNVAMESRDGLRLFLDQVPAYIAPVPQFTNDVVFRSRGSGATLTNAALEVPGVFQPQRTYCVYDLMDPVTKTFKYVINESPPDAPLVHKRPNDIQYRYLGCFLTESTGRIRPFVKYGNSYVYESGLDGVAAQGAGAQWQTASLTSFLPPWAQVVTLQLELDVISNTSGYSLYVRVPNRGSNVYTITASPDNTPFRHYATAVVNVPIVAVTQEIEWGVGNPAAAPAGVANASIKVLGFLEG